MKKIELTNDEHNSLRRLMIAVEKCQLDHEGDIYIFEKSEEFKGGYNAFLVKSSDLEFLKKIQHKIQK